MPRTDGVYSPPAGTKGVPNTTIQSVPYNTLIDDLSADANAPRPVTAGGTGATSASGARTALGLEIGTNVQAYDVGLQSIAGLTTSANQMLYTTAADAYSTTAVTPFARTILDDADAAAAKGTLGLAAVASSGSASDLMTGTLADARLPDTMSGKAFNGPIVISASSATSAFDYLHLRPTDYGPGKPGLFFQKNGAGAVWSINSWDGSNTNGTINFNASSITHNSNMIMTSAGGTFAGAIAGTSANFNGNMVVSDLVATGSDISIQTAGNRHLWFQTAGGVKRGLVYHDDIGGYLGLFVYNANGIYDRGLNLYENGVASWYGHELTVGQNFAGSGEIRLKAASNSGWRWIAVNDHTVHLQRSTNDFDAVTTFMRIDSSGNMYFDNSTYVTGGIFQSLSSGLGTNFKVGDDVWIGDINEGNTMAVRGVQNVNVGYIRFGTGSNKLGVDATINGDRLTWASWLLQGDGNQYLPSVGMWLYQALDGKVGLHTGSNANETNFPVGHLLMMYTGGSIVNRNQTAAPSLSAVDSRFYREVGDASAGTPLSGTWRARGHISDDYVQVQRTA